MVLNAPVQFYMNVFDLRSYARYVLVSSQYPLLHIIPYTPPTVYIKIWFNIFFCKHPVRHWLNIFYALSIMSAKHRKVGTVISYQGISVHFEMLNK